MKPQLTINYGNKFWDLGGRCHREDGPAVIYAYKSKFWYLHGIEYSQKEWFSLMLKNNLS